HRRRGAVGGDRTLRRDGCAGGGRRTGRGGTRLAAPPRSGAVVTATKWHRIDLCAQQSLCTAPSERRSWRYGSRVALTPPPCSRYRVGGGHRRAVELRCR